MTEDFTEYVVGSTASTASDGIEGLGLEGGDNRPEVHQSRGK